MPVLQIELVFLQERCAKLWGLYVLEGQPCGASEYAHPCPTRPSAIRLQIVFAASSPMTPAVTSGR